VVKAFGMVAPEEPPTMERLILTPQTSTMPVLVEEPEQERPLQPYERLE
jgi:hypothetical protein